MNTLLQDLRYGVRMLRKSLGFTAVALVTLALGIGANTAIFSVVKPALLQALPYQQPERLVQIWSTRTTGDFTQMEVSYPDFVDIRDHNQVFQQLGGYSMTGATYSGPNGAEQVPTPVASANFFDVLGVRMALGRSFQPDADGAHGEKAVILSYGGWQRRFGGDRNILGRSLKFDGELRTVVGVLPRDFQFAPGLSADFWMPLAVKGGFRTRRNGYWFHPVGRLKPGVRMQQAQADITTLMQQLQIQYPDSNASVSARLTPLREELVGPVRPILLLLTAAVGVVLLITCANLAGLFLARSVGRHKEIAIRVSVGASHRRILRQLLTESVMLALLGGVLGVVLAVSAIPVMIASTPKVLVQTMPFLEQARVDGGVLLFSAVVALLAGILFGLAPAIQIFKPALQDALQEAGRSVVSGASHRFRNALVIAEIAMAIVLLAGAGLLMKSLLRVISVDPGFHTDHLLSVNVSMPSNRYTKAAQVNTFEQTMRDRLKALPGVKEVVTVSVLPLSGGGNTSRFVLEGRRSAAAQEEHEANSRDISPNYFAAMGIPLRAGRNFTDQDKKDSPSVVIINQTLADEVFRGVDPIGKRIDFTFSSKPLLNEVVGIVGDENVTNLDSKPTPVVYSPFAQGPGTFFSVAIRTSMDPIALESAVRRTINDLDPDVAAYGMASMDQVIAQSPSIFLRKLPAIVVTAFALLALLLASLGIYGLLAYSVAQRTRELGIRLALGAKRVDLLKLVVANGMKLAVTGTVLGILGEVGAGYALASILFQVKPTDIAIMTGVPLLLLTVALLASYIPARRATRIDPIVALRQE
jgi:predicted permease